MNNSVPEISAILISYNGREFLPECLGTLSDDLKSFQHEIIIVDNNSQDGSADYICSKHPGCELIVNASNLGFAPAVNIGIRAARGKFLYVLNQDLRFRSGCAAVLVNRLKNDRSLGMAGPGYCDFEGNRISSARAFPRQRDIWYDAFLLNRIFSKSHEFGRWKMNWFSHDREEYVDQPMGAVMMIPRNTIDKIGLMDERFWMYMNDVDFCRRMDEAGLRRLYCPSAVVEHAVGGATSKRPYRHVLISHLAFIRYFHKYAKWYQYSALALNGLFLLIAIVPHIAVRFFKRMFT